MDAMDGPITQQLRAVTSTSAVPIPRPRNTNPYRADPVNTSRDDSARRARSNSLL